MGFLRKNKSESQKDRDIKLTQDSPAVDCADTEQESIYGDDFDENISPEPITREEFHNMAEKNLYNALEDSSDENMSDSKPVSNSDTVDSQAESDTLRNDYESDESLDDTPDNAMSEPINNTLESVVFDEEDDFVADQQKVVDSASKEFDTIKTKLNQKPKKIKKPTMTFGEFMKKYNRGIKTAAVVFGIFFTACLGLYIYGCATIPSGVMGRNIYIEDVNISNLTYDEALKKVQDKNLLDNYNLTLVSHNQSYDIDGVEIGLSAKIEDTVDKAMRYGKTGNIFIDGFANALQVIKRHTVLPSANVNEEILRQKIMDFGNQIYGELQEHQLEIGEGEVICIPGHTGFSGNADEAYNEVIYAIEHENFSRIRVTLQSASPAELSIETLDAFTYQEAQDAHFEVKDNQVTTVNEIWGRYLNLDEAEPLTKLVREGGEIVKIPFYTSAPNVTADQLNSKLFNATLATYSTSYGGSSSNRAGNIINASSKINNKVLAPGEVFSFNDTVGKRTQANGFFPAPEYANGETVIGIGGGTCQVSSTLYNAVLYADLAIVSRLNHMFAVGYCPLGQDATVSDSGVDFKFSNNTEYPIKIVASASGGSITVKIMGTQRDVEHVVKIQNNVSYSGANRNVRSYRYVYDPNGTLLRQDDLGNSYYMSHTQAAASSPNPASSGAPSAGTSTPSSGATASPSAPSNGASSGASTAPLPGSSSGSSTGTSGSAPPSTSTSQGAADGEIESTP